MAIKKEYLEKCIEEKLSMKEMATGCDWSIGTVRHWLKKYGLKTACKVGVKPGGVHGVIEGQHYCGSCEKHLEHSKFYARLRGGFTGRCKECVLKDSAKRSEEKYKQRKYMAISYKGGCCQNCSYNKNYTSLCFHHTDPSRKEFNIDSRQLRMRKLSVIMEELDKCILLCHNCHSETHNPTRTMKSLLEQFKDSDTQV